MKRLPHPPDKVGTFAFGFGDLDGDGDLDILVGKGSTLDRTRILIGDGRGRFVDETVKRMPYEKGTQTQAIAVADVDGDGDLDAFVGQFGRFSSAPDRLLINDGRGFFTDRSLKQLPQFRGRNQLVTESAHFVDLDGDGDLDLTFVNHGGGLGPLVIYWNDGKGKFSFAWGHVPTLPSMGYGLAVGDIDGDKDVDLIYGTDRDGIHVLINDGKKRFVDMKKSRISRSEEFESIPALADVDGDGDLDLVVGKVLQTAPKKPAQTTLYLNNGKGYFKEVTSTQMPKDNDVTMQVRVADFDLDGDQDIFVINQAFGPRPQWGSKFYANDGKGFFTDRSKEFFPLGALKVGTLSDCMTVGIGDLDGDGDLDLVAGKIGLYSGRGPINDVLVWNLTRHLYAPGQNGSRYPIDVWGEPGQYAFLLAGLAQKRLRLPGLGVLELDLSQALLWPTSLLIPKSRKNRWTLTLPSSLKGRKLYSQAFLYDPGQPRRSHLTNAFEDSIK